MGFNAPKLHLGYEVRRNEGLRVNINHLGFFNTHRNVNTRAYVLTFPPPTEKQPPRQGPNPRNIQTPPAIFFKGSRLTCFLVYVQPFGQSLGSVCAIEVLRPGRVLRSNAVTEPSFGAH